jgi:hypothetical protein
VVILLRNSCRGRNTISREPAVSSQLRERGSTADGRSTCETLACLVNNRIRYSSCPTRPVLLSLSANLVSRGARQLRTATSPCVVDSARDLDRIGELIRLIDRINYQDAGKREKRESPRSLLEKSEHVAAESCHERRNGKTVFRWRKHEAAGEVHAASRLRFDFCHEDFITEKRDGYRLPIDVSKAVAACIRHALLRFLSSARISRVKDG